MNKKGLVFALSVLLSFYQCAWAVVGVQVTPDNWDIGEGGPGEWTSPEFTVKNIGNETAKINIRGTDTQNWTLGPGPGINMFSVDFTHNTGGWDTVKKIDLALHNGMDGGSSYNFSLKFRAPGVITPPTLTTLQNFAITLSAVSPAIGSWQFQTIDTRNISYPCVAAGPNCRPSIAYSISGSLYFAKWDGAVWVIESLNENGWNPCVVFDANNIPHIVWYANNELKYAVWNVNSSAWDKKTIDTSPPEGSLTITKRSVVIDSLGNPNVCYRKYGVGLCYAKWNGVSWDIQIVDSYQYSGSARIALGANNDVHIVYTGLNSIKYARLIDNSWSIETVDQVTNQPSIAIDSQNVPHVAYWTSSGLKYAKKDGQSWYSYIILNSAPPPTQGIDIDVDNNDLPYIAYNLYMPNLYIAKWDGYMWVFNQIGAAANSFSMALGSNNNIFYAMDGGLRIGIWR
ncbi:MAG: hypothetical protein JW803_08815 [Endomicrobiales bacterium]|nr:hypothetical protein [Endomicrobiales bacterium]